MSFRAEISRRGRAMTLDESRRLFRSSIYRAVTTIRAILFTIEMKIFSHHALPLFPIEFHPDDKSADLSRLSGKRSSFARWGLEVLKTRIGRYFIQRVRSRGNFLTPREAAKSVAPASIINASDSSRARIVED